MSLETAKAFYDKAVTDQSLQEKIRRVGKSGTSPKEKLNSLVAIANEAGFALSPSQIVDYSKLETERQHAPHDRPEDLFDDDPHSCLFTDCDTNICNH